MGAGFKGRRWMAVADDRDGRQDWVVSGFGGSVTKQYVD